MSQESGRGDSGEDCASGGIEPHHRGNDHSQRPFRSDHYSFPPPPPPRPVKATDNSLQLTLVTQGPSESFTSTPIVSHRPYCPCTKWFLVWIFKFRNHQKSGSIVASSLKLTLFSNCTEMCIPSLPFGSLNEPGPFYIQYIHTSTVSLVRRKFRFLSWSDSDESFGVE
jgi:hypothetical protein